jgi:hypothetical protein
MRRRLNDQSGQALIEGLLALGLVVLVVAVGVQAFAYAHARSVAIAAAQDGAETAASDTPAGTNRADALLQAAGGVGHSLHATGAVDGGEVTITVTGPPPRIFPLGLFLPNITASASLPLEQYPADEGGP